MIMFLWIALGLVGGLLIRTGTTIIDDEEWNSESHCEVTATDLAWILAGVIAGPIGLMIGVALITVVLAVMLVINLHSIFERGPIFNICDLFRRKSDG